MPQNATFHCAILAKLICTRALECQQNFFPLCCVSGVSDILCICPKWQMYLSKSRNVFWPNWTALECQQKLFSSSSMVCQQGGRINFSPVANMVTFFKNEKLIQNVFVYLANCICPNWWMYLSKFTNIFSAMSMEAMEGG